jgi:DNA-binding beta-propeller fold protein YncE
MRLSSLLLLSVLCLCSSALLPSTGLAAVVEATPRPLLEIGPFSTAHRDVDMVSPKSVLFHPVLPKFYVNALEAGKTLVYSRNFERLTTIEHRFASHSTLTPGQAFWGKPVEGWFTHEGRYLWLTYYRFSDDPQAQGGSGFSVVDTTTDKIVATYPTGNIPKFVTATSDSSKLAVVLWGENKVELFDIRDPLHAHRASIVQLGGPVLAPRGSDRDVTCGGCLRGAAFVPGSTLLAVAKMGGGGLYLVDTATAQQVRFLPRVPATPRHLQVYGDYLYLSANVSGTVGRISLVDLRRAAADPHFEPPVHSRRIGVGARTLKVVKDQVYVALNESKQVAVMNLDFSNLRYLPAPAFPVGLDVQEDLLAVTSQGKKGVGGHRVWVYRLPEGASAENVSPR